MKELLNFFIETGKLKGMDRKGWVLRGVKNPESIAEHTFRVALMAWLLGSQKKHNLKIERLIKMALVHDLCEIYAGDTTPYDSILPKNKKELPALMEKWPRFSQKQKEKLKKDKFNKESKALKKLVKKLPEKLQKEINNLWMDYEKGLSAEGRFFKQTDRIENFLQAMEYWEKSNKMPRGSWWMQAREIFDDPVILDFMSVIDKKFSKKL